MDRSAGHASIAYRRSRRAKHLRITITPSQTVTVTVPSRVAMEEAQAFVRSKHRWIQGHLETLRRRQSVLDKMPKFSDAQLRQAQETLLRRLASFSQQYHLPYNRTAFRCQKTRWGSCSPKNNISLNINLVYLPEHLQDYVLLHELCHVRHKNHSRDFWDLLDRCCGNHARRYARELRGCGMPLSAEKRVAEG